MCVVKQIHLSRSKDHAITVFAKHNRNRRWIVAIGKYSSAVIANYIYGVRRLRYTRIVIGHVNVHIDVTSRSA